jgi:hypothetical protein
MVASVKMTAYWDVAPCSLIGVDRCFRGAYCLHDQPDGGGSMRLHGATSQKALIFILTAVRT